MCRIVMQRIVIWPNNRIPIIRLAVRVVVVRLSSCSYLRGMKGTGVCISEIPPPSLQRLQEIGTLEVFGHIVVQASDNFVDGFLPGLFRVFSSHQGLEELAKGLFYDVTKRFWSLKWNKGNSNYKTEKIKIKIHPVNLSDYIEIDHSKIILLTISSPSVISSFVTSSAGEL